MKPVVTHAHYHATPPAVGGEQRVAEEPADKTGHLVLAHRQMDQAVGSVTESLLLEVVVAREERGPRHLMEQHEDGVVGKPLVPHIDTDLTHRDAPTAQELPLVLGDILVE